MNNGRYYMYIILGMAFVTYLPRMLPLTLLSKKNIPDILTRFLGYIPVAVLSALLFPSIMMVDGKMSVGLSNHLSLAALLTFPVALKTKNMFATVLLGMVIVVIIGRVL